MHEIRGFGNEAQSIKELSRRVVSKLLIAVRTCTRENSKGSHSRNPCWTLLRAREKFFYYFSIFANSAATYSQKLTTKGRRRISTEKYFSLVHAWNKRVCWNLVPDPVSNSRKISSIDRKDTTHILPTLYRTPYIFLKIECLYFL